MGTKFKVRLKTNTKFQIFFSLLAISVSVTLVGLFVFDKQFEQTVYKGFFKAEIIKVLGTSGQMSYGAIKYKGRTHRIRSAMLLKLNQKVCVGIVEPSILIRFPGYMVVDDVNCSQQEN